MALSVREKSDLHAKNLEVPYAVGKYTTGLERRTDIMVAIPAFNEEVAIGSIVARCKKYADSVVVIDDGSKDHTVEVAMLVGAEVISHKKNGGYGAAIKTCFDVARARGVSAMVIIDGDGQHDPDNIPMLIAEMKRTGADIVIGSRFIKGNEKNQHIPAFRKVGMKVLDTATVISSGLKISDSQSGFRAYSENAIHEINLGDEGMGVGSEILIKAADVNLEIVEVPIKTRYDIPDTSTKNPVVHGVEVLGSIVLISSQRQPMIYLGIPGLALLFIGSCLTFYQLEGASAAMFMAIMLCMIAGTLCIFTALTVRSIQRIFRALPESN
jgi:glycosyltransferase involved in cell wall biosynthesis